MLGVHEKNLPQFVYTDQINYTNHVRLFILSVFDWATGTSRFSQPFFLFIFGFFAFYTSIYLT